MSALAANLKELRESKNLTQLDIGNYLEMSRVGYSKYERGTAEPNIASLIKLADLYNITIDELVGRSVPAESIQLRDIQKQKEIKEQVKSIVGAVTKEFL